MNTPTLAAVGFAIDRTPFVFVAPALPPRRDDLARRLPADRIRRTSMREIRIVAPHERPADRVFQRVPAARTSPQRLGVRGDGLHVPDRVVGYH